MADLASNLARKYFAVSGGELAIGGVGVRRLAEMHGTPSFVYDQGVMDRRIDELRAALPPGFAICYSVKANPNLSVIRHFVARGCGLEVASAGEFGLALKAGCEPRNILFAGPGKTEAELEYVLSQGIGEIHIESLQEVRRVAAISSQLGIRAAVSIRVNPASDAEGGAMRMGGRPAAFGIDEEQLERALDAVLECSALEFHGVHIFAGTQILDANTLTAQYRHGLTVGRRAAQYARSPLHTIDFGGGLGIPYFTHEQPLDLEQLRAGLADLFHGAESNPALSGTRFVVEPGRFLVGEAGVYLAHVNDIKVSRGKKFLILDGGMNHHLAASGNLGQTIKRNYPIAIANRMDTPASETVDVVGPLCTPLDTVARNVALPPAEIGDLIAIFQSGAYGRSASPLGFLSHPAPAEILADRGTAELIAARGEITTFGVPAIAMKGR
jgi:diaminopimelate decarboxylase